MEPNFQVVVPLKLRFELLPKRFRLLLNKNDRFIRLLALVSRRRNEARGYAKCEQVVQKVKGLTLCVAIIMFKRHQ